MIDFCFSKFIIVLNFTLHTNLGVIIFSGKIKCDFILIAIDFVFFIEFYFVFF